jgi:hypothetical protein
LTLRPEIPQVSEMLASKPQTHKAGLRYVVVFSLAGARQTGAYATFVKMRFLVAQSRLLTLRP